MIPPRTRGGNVPQGKVNCQTHAAHAARAARMEKIYETPRVSPARALGADCVLVKSTVIVTIQSEEIFLYNFVHFGIVLQNSLTDLPRIHPDLSFDNNHQELQL